MRSGYLSLKFKKPIKDSESLTGNEPHNFLILRDLSHSHELYAMVSVKHSFNHYAVMVWTILQLRRTILKIHFYVPTTMYLVGCRIKLSVYIYIYDGWKCCIGKTRDIIQSSNQRRKFKVLVSGCNFTPYPTPRLALHATGSQTSLSALSWH